MTASASSWAITVEALSKEYLSLGRLIFAARSSRTPNVALRDVSFRVQRGETIGLLGPNGAGKTTLLKILATLIAPTKGTVHVDGIDVATRPQDARRRIGLVSCDERSFYWRLTGRQNLQFFGALYRLSRSQTEERIDSTLDTLGLSDAADRPYQSYSSGMKQKLGIARGLLARPSVVLYDEPTRSLDPVSSHNIRTWILDERRRSPWQTHIIATNQMTEAEQLCDRVLIVSRGCIVARGTIGELRRKWRDADADVHRIVYRRGSPVPVFSADEAVGLLEVTQTSGDDRDQHVVCVRAVRGSAALSVALGRILRHGGTIERCDTSEPTFDDVFRAAVTDSPARVAEECTS